MAAPALPVTVRCSWPNPKSAKGPSWMREAGNEWQQKGATTGTLCTLHSALCTVCGSWIKQSAVILSADKAITAMSRMSRRESRDAVCAVESVRLEFKSGANEPPPAAAASEQTQSGRFDHYGYHPKWLWIAPQSRDGRPAQAMTTLSFSWWWVSLPSPFSTVLRPCVLGLLFGRVDSGLIQTWHKSHSGVYFNFYVNINYERQGMTQRDTAAGQAALNIANFRGFSSLFSALKWELMSCPLSRWHVKSWQIFL